MGTKGLWEENKDKIIIFSFFVLAIFYFGSFLTPQKMISGSDWILSGYTNHYSWVNYIKAHKRLPMWDGYNFSGNPVMTTRGGGGIVYPLNIFYFIFPVHLGLAVMYIVHTFLAGLGMWLLLKEYKLSSFSSLVGAISFMFAGQLITTTEGGHLVRMIAVVFLPFAFLFLHKALQSKKIRDFIIFGGVTGAFLLAGQVQMSYWGMIGVLSYFIFEIFRRRRRLDKKDLLRIGGFFSAGMIVLLLIIMVKFLPPALSLGYGARGVTRGYAYSTSWSVPTAELFDLVVPHFSGILKNYWGENYFRLDSRYLGILPLILFGLAFLYRDKKHIIRYFAFFTGVTLLLALGKNTPLFRLYYYLVPMANKFRGPSMFFFLTTFGIAVLSGFGAQVLMDLVSKKDDETERKAFIYVVSTVGVILLAAIIVSIGDASVLQAMKSHFGNAWMGIMGRGDIRQKIFLMEQNFGNFKKSLWISSLLFIINGGLIIAIIKRKLDFRLAVPIFALVLLCDQWSIDLKYLSASSRPERYFAADEVTKFVRASEDLFRVFPFNYEGRSQNLYFKFHGIYNVGGYGPNPPGRYQDFIGAGRSVMFNPVNLIKYPHLSAMLNAKYIIGPRLPEDLTGYDDRVRGIIKEYKDFYSNFEVAFIGREHQVLENKGFLPRASLIYDYAVVDSAQEVLSKILSPEFKPGNVVFLEEDPEVTLSEGTGEVKINKIIENEKILDVKTSKPAFLIVRENYHPDWKCYIDGENEKIYKANYIFYGVFLPEGEHTVRFVYESRIFNIASLFSFIGLIILLAVVVAAFSFKRK
jgi:hypothetical protein